MATPQVPRIHPTALIAPEAELAEDVQVGPYVIIEGPVRIGPGCVLRPFVHLCGPLTMGRGNQVYTGAVLGERPQHLNYRDEPTSLEIGDDNTFREHVTVHRATTQAWTTRLGSRNLFMAHSHIAHDCQVGDGCLFANGALLAGHCHIGNNVYLSGNCAIHQFCRVGRLALLSGASISTKDIPPFIMQHGRDSIAGVNVVGMRRAGMTGDQIHRVRRAYQILYREGRILSAALQRLEQELGDCDAIREMITFIRQSGRGINLLRERGRDLAA